MKSALCIAFILMAYAFVSNEDYKDQTALAAMAPKLKHAAVWAK